MMGEKVSYETETKCYFNDDKCRFLIADREWTVDEQREEHQDGDVYSNRPYEMTQTCTNCLLGKILDELRK